MSAFGNVETAQSFDPEDLSQARELVDGWLSTARDAMVSFLDQRPDPEGTGSFYNDSKAYGLGPKTLLPLERSRITTTARAYAGLLYADHRLGRAKTGRAAAHWESFFQTYIEKIGVSYSNPKRSGAFSQSARHFTGQKATSARLNNFEIAHLADLILVGDAIQRFPATFPDCDREASSSGMKAIRKHLVARVQRALAREETDEASQRNAEVPFESESPESKHFFVTLHLLRAVAIHCPDEKKGAEYGFKRLAAHARTFCVEQCFVQQRGVQHRQDPARLVFACLIYCFCAEEVDKELLVAVCETLAALQRPSGKWPTSHPIMRKKQVNWYIASHELALSLTWLYFQPRLPDSGRVLVLRMLRRYFENWLIPTFRRVQIKKQDENENAEAERWISGWYDDSVVGQQRVVGWATAIVCHFLANFGRIVDDALNRSVVETLGLEIEAQNYAIDETHPKSNGRWQGAGAFFNVALWPDVPPVCWSRTQWPESDLSDQIAHNWTDPSDNASFSRKIAHHVLDPMVNGLRQRPDGCIAGILDGPPGTRKTSFVKEIARILKAPYVPVPASTIFEHGFDRMEARANEVFRRLNYLTGCVIFFDEFEEFFRQRPDGDSEATSRFHNRTIAAFTTSAMLPRMQALRDEKRSLVFLATNHLDGVDDAIVRKGRFDYQETIKHPSVSRFRDPTSSYFLRPANRFLDDLGIDRSPIADADETRLQLLAEIVGEVFDQIMKESHGTSKIQTYQKLVPSPNRSESDSADNETFYIRFSHVEPTARLAWDRIRNATQKKDKDIALSDDDRKEIVNDVYQDLLARIEEACRQQLCDDTPVKGPGPLPEPIGDAEDN